MLRCTLLPLAAALACGPLAESAAPSTRVADPPPGVGADNPAPTPTPTTSGWTALPIAPGCTVQVADAPAALKAPLDWRPCVGGPGGCSELSRADANLAVQGLGHGDRVSLAVFESLPGPRARYLLTPRDGPPFFAVEGPRDTQCSLAIVGLSDDGAVVEISFDNADGFASRAYLRGPLADDPAWRRVTAVLPRRDYPDFIGESVFSAGGRVVVEQNGGPLRWFDAETKRWHEVPGSHDGWACCARGHGDAVTFLIESIPERTLAARLGEPAHPLRRGAVDGISPIAIEGTRAVWLEGRGRDNNNLYRRIELWTGALGPGLTLEDATLVTALPRTTMTTPTLGGGTVTVPLQDRGLLILRPGEPGTRTFMPPAGLMIERLLWVTRDEIAVEIGPGGRHVEPSRIQRIPLAALPPSP